MELIIPLRQIDLPLQIDHLGDLGADFTALHTTITTLVPGRAATCSASSAPRSSQSKSSSAVR